MFNKDIEKWILQNSGKSEETENNSKQEKMDDYTKENLPKIVHHNEHNTWTLKITSKMACGGMCVTNVLRTRWHYEYSVNANDGMDDCIYIYYPNL